MTETKMIAADTARFDRACNDLAGALERFAALTQQIARDIRSTTAALRTASAAGLDKKAA